MNRFTVLALALLPGGFILSSCLVEPYPTHEVMISGSEPGSEVYVREDPPPPREEVIVGVAPSPSYVWVGGYWNWHRSNWYWLSGRWAARPRPEAVWAPGSWGRHPNGHVWIPGRWH